MTICWNNGRFSNVSILAEDNVVESHNTTLQPRWPSSLQFRVRLHWASASTLRWPMQHSSHWNQRSYSKLGYNPSLGWLYLFPLISMRAVSQASSQCWLSVDADAWCKRALSVYRLLFFRDYFDVGKSNVNLVFTIDLFSTQCLTFLKYINEASVMLDV